jgi:hypothetical protein
MICKPKKFGKHYIMERPFLEKKLLRAIISDSFPFLNKVKINVLNLIKVILFAQNFKRTF